MQIIKTTIPIIIPQRVPRDCPEAIAIIIDNNNPTGNITAPLKQPVGYFYYFEPLDFDRFSFQ